ncbi:hypothetical protein KIN20_033783 [Parelaphostrongylus tenuis]|uniref:Uncharacterized protein n=1 Tax=Parelaphostrongylus tenuis TaxID=148309 RepID=A0AAD5R975_PARTN|nr:hypothetical protein KIN20_033783 [Parelaphostrongylus tenuis]
MRIGRISDSIVMDSMDGLPDEDRNVYTVNGHTSVELNRCTVPPLDQRRGNMRSCIVTTTKSCVDFTSQIAVQPHYTSERHVNGSAFAAVERKLRRETQRCCCSGSKEAPARLNLSGAVAAAVQRQLQREISTVLTQSQCRCNFNVNPQLCCCCSNKTADLT